MRIIIALGNYNNNDQQFNKHDFQHYTFDQWLRNDNTKLYDYQSHI